MTTLGEPLAYKDIRNENDSIREIESTLKPHNRIKFSPIDND